MNNSQRHVIDKKFPAILFEQHKDIIQIITVPHKSPLLLQGSIADRLYYVNDGVLRLWHNHDGKDVTLQFFLPGQIVCSFESFYLKAASKFSLETVTNCTLSYILRDDIMRMLETETLVQHFMTEYACNRFIEYNNLFLSRIQLSPEERYRELLTERPELLELVPHHYVASYLGISATSLSRIRKRISEKESEKI